ncbi:hypothetical protein AS034_03215 [[Bacillus] enclensis]|uniref:Uncharacterized protein n=1 Tax=[Bacillus] enclensis TaxID=1402860 RepID=A0A0V8HL09_9BACI|nr:hypothetical protein [[Bacillus] enclensis]KSU63276.1 hypothetical protein AS034_03215 [[Bacillus] enclensis]SCB81225.1 hypothetical protein GA0061094_0669 [[Bacillus] enclensis]
MDQGMGMEGIGVFFGLFSILYIGIALFITVLTIVFIFKAMSFMKHKTENDRRLLQALEKMDPTHKHEDKEYL